MSSNYSVCLLTQGSGSEPEFLVSEVNLRPGQEFAPNSRGAILLSSGFPSISPDSGFPLSPTLQLNNDLTAGSDEMLKRLALAEMAKVQATTYRSYTIDPDPRLCVIGADPEKVNKFLDTYSGMLEIEPILLSGYDPELPTANDLEITKTQDGYLLDYSVRTPVNIEKCTYCGECGPVCPEACLNEHLFVDFTACTFCKECEKACVHGAIDIYGAEQRQMRIPAIMVLEGTKLELPVDTTSIYQENGLAAFFATQFGSQVDEVVLCDSALCQFSGKLGYGCSRCIDTCSHGAIFTSEKGVHVDPLKCEECGGCVATCPTGAMQYERFSDSSFISYIQSIDLAAGTTVVLGSEKALHKLWWQSGDKRFEDVIFVEYTEIKALTLFHLLFLYASGAGKIVLLGLDEEFENMEPFQRQAALAGSLLNTYCQDTSAIEISTVQQFLTRENLKSEFSLSAPLVDLTVGSRRENLATVLKYFTDQTGRQARIKANKLLPFATIFCDDSRCTHCFACLNDCRIQALSARDDEQALMSRSALCVGCGICVKVCPENALQMIPGATLDEKFFNREMLAEAEAMKCKKCGKVFGSKKSFERVMSILKQKESVDTSHFEYCETCRVVNLFESAE